MSTLTILQRNESQIQKEKERILNIAKQNGFIEFYEALKATGFSVTVTDFQQLSYGNQEGLLNWLKRKTLERNPIELPITEEAKMNMIQLADYTSLLKAYNKLSNNRVIRNTVFSLNVNDSGEVVLSDSALQRITDDYTLYGNDKQAEALQELTEIKDKMESFFKKYSFNPTKAITCNIYNEFSLNVNVISFDVR